MYVSETHSTHHLSAAGLQTDVSNGSMNQL